MHAEKTLKMLRMKMNLGFVLISCCFLVFMYILIGVAEAQTPNKTTAPAEAAALNSLFDKWGISQTGNNRLWNISGEVCSGVAIIATDVNATNPSIKCECKDRNGTLCHITALQIDGLDYGNVAGPIPAELFNLTYLTILRLEKNFLSGPFPPSIGRLTRLQLLTFGHNAFSGELPKELGYLTDLWLLAFGSTNFSGPLPAELGNLTKLQQLYMDSSGVSGPIPSTFAALGKLEIFWVQDNALTGQIPDFIGSWSRLTNLSFQGNSFHGQIPASFANLTSMKDLMISDVSNGTSSLDFLSNMRSLERLTLRNNNISGSIPADIGKISNLTLLDLSFNSLTGRIPDSLFNMSRLTYLFLGNNKLNGTLPTQRAQSLLVLDLSYNELSGSFPSWVSGANLQLNLVKNNFMVPRSNSSGLPPGLSCLQRNSRCHIGSPLYSGFAINCGGFEITSSDQIVYESDNDDKTFAPATYFMSSSNRWAVSNVGLPTKTNNPEFRSSTISPILNTSDPVLFQTARASAGSLRYYGLGLKNGNYSVTLKFAETTIMNPPGWRSVGRRVFDVFIQGERVLQDFDIRREAGEASLTAVQRSFQVQVSENYLEIHFFWAGKGTWGVPRAAIYGPSISAISALRNSEGNNRIGLIAGIVGSVAIFGLVAAFAAYFFVMRRKRNATSEHEEFLGMDTKPYTYSYEELKAATNDFNPANKLGEGGFGAVFKGTLADGRVVAAKQLSVKSHQGKSQFAAEIATISAVQHRNLVKLYGCCIEADKRLLVYEYHENKSLDQALFGNSGLHLDWATRFKICLGVARGLAYLHEESRLKIVHRDVKASNILLDSHLNPKISDFGLAKLYDDKETHISTRVAGTTGYMAPEYALLGLLTEKADVFSFGIVALEIISGKRSSYSTMEEGKIYLLGLAWQLYENKCELELVDKNLDEFNKDEASRLIGVAFLCTQMSPGLRPKMSRVVAMLSGDIEVASVTTKPGYLTDWKFSDTSSFITTTPIASSSNTTIDT